MFTGNRGLRTDDPGERNRAARREHRQRRRRHDEHAHLGNSRFHPSREDHARDDDPPRQLVRAHHVDVEMLALPRVTKPDRGLEPVGDAEDVMNPSLSDIHVERSEVYSCL